MDCGSPRLLDGAPINAWRRPCHSMTSPVRRCDVICVDPVVDSFGGGRTRTPSSIGGSKRLNGQGCTDFTFMTCAILLPRGCSKPEWIISSSKNFLAIDFPEPVACT